MKINHLFPANRKLPAYQTYILISGASAFFFSVVFTISAVYNINAAGLNPLQLMLVGTALEAAVFLFEIPTGVVADVYSRRLSIVIGLFVIGLGFCLWGSLTFFLTILLAQVLWGLGYTFCSGATEAWIADELENKGVARVFLRGSQSGQVGSLLGTVVSVALASIALRLPVLAGGLLFIALALLLVFLMPETHFAPAPRTERSTWRHLSATLKAGLAIVRRKQVLKLILIAGVFFGLASEGFDRLWEMHFLKSYVFPAVGSLKPVVWFGLINAVAMLLSIIAAEIAKRRIDAESHQALGWFVVIFNLLISAGVVAFALAGNFALAVASYWTAFLFRQVNSPLRAAWLNHQLESRTRATVISMSSQVDSMGQIVGGPLLGAVATAFSITLAMGLSGLLLLPALPLYVLAIRKGPKRHSPARNETK